MQFSNINKILLLALTFFYNCTLITPIVADQSPDVEQMQEQTDAATVEQSLADFPPELLELLQKEQATLFEKLLGSTLDQFKRFDTIAEYYAQVINNNQLQNINKKEAISHIRNLRGLFNSLKTSSYVVVEPTSIKILSDLIKALIEHFKFISNNGLTILPEIDLQACITRSASEELDLEALEKQITTNEKELANIEQQSKYLGLSLFNRAYRKTEQFISDYGLVRKALIGMGLGLATYILIAPLREEWVQNIPVLNELKKFIGDRPKVNPLTNEDNLETLTPFGKIDYYTGKHGVGIVDLSLPSLLTIPVIANFYARDWNNLSAWFKKNLESVRGKLRGGPIERTVESWIIEPKLRFKDIIGKEHIKNELMRIVNFIEDQDRYIRAGNRPETGYLLMGKSGTGKSAIAEALAGEMKDRLDKVKFFNFSPADIKRIPGQLEGVMAYAKDNAPCVVFIDEIDMTLWQRERDAAGTSLALTTLSGVMTKDIEHTVILIGATNRPQNLDSALLRKGRFGKQLFFDNPTYQDRITFLQKELENRGISTISENYLKRISAESENAILPQIAAVIEKALYYAKISNETLSEQHIERAFDEEIRQIIFDKPTISDKDLKLISVHEAGHAIATILLDSSKRLVKSTILPVMAKIQEEAIWMKYWQKNNQKPIEQGKTFIANSSTNALNLESYDDLVKQIKIELAGHAAEVVIYSRSSYRHHMTDRERALAIAKHLFAKGLPLDQVDDNQLKNINQQAMSFLDACEAEMVQLFTQYKDMLLKLADALATKQTMTATEVQECIHVQK
jgi:ATP-dependent Zn protease